MLKHKTELPNLDSVRSAFESFFKRQYCERGAILKTKVKDVVMCPDMAELFEDQNVDEKYVRDILQLLKLNKLAEFESYSVWYTGQLPVLTAAERERIVPLTWADKAKVPAGFQIVHPLRKREASSSDSDEVLDSFKMPSKTAPRSTGKTSKPDMPEDVLSVPSTDWSPPSSRAYDVRTDDDDADVSTQMGAKLTNASVSIPMAILLKSALKKIITGRQDIVIPDLASAIVRALPVKTLLLKELEILQIPNGLKALLELDGIEDSTHTDTGGHSPSLVSSVQQYSVSGTVTIALEALRDNVLLLLSQKFGNPAIVGPAVEEAFGRFKSGAVLRVESSVKATII